MAGSGQPSEKMGRLGGALLLAPPLGGSVGFALAGLIGQLAGHFGEQPATLPSLISAALSAGAFGFLGGVVGGAILMTVLWLPTHAVLYSSERRTLRAYLFGGAIFLTSVYALFALTGRWPILTLPLALLPHLCIGAVFWHFRRPDRDAPNPPTPAS